MNGPTGIPTFPTDKLTPIGAVVRSDAPGRIDDAVTDPRTRRRVEKRRMARLARERAAVEQIAELPGPMEDVVIILTGNFHGFDVLGAVLDLAGCPADEVYIATLGFNRRQTDDLAAMLDSGQIGSLTFVVSHMFTEKNAGEFGHLQQTLTARGQRCANTRNHAKLMLLKLADGRHIVTHGSLNLRRCNSYEQLAISHDAELYAFFAEFLELAIAGGLTP